MTDAEPVLSLYEAAGGAETFERLVRRFYAGVATDSLLRPMYPADLAEPIRHLTLFLIQYFGGPQTYSAERGHPRLRQRHARFQIDRSARNAWVRHMTAALVSLDLPEPQYAEVLRYIEDSATFLINHTGQERDDLMAR